MRLRHAKRPGFLRPLMPRSLPHGHRVCKHFPLPRSIKTGGQHHPPKASATTASANLDGHADREQGIGTLCADRLEDQTAHTEHGEESLVVAANVANEQTERRVNQPVVVGIVVFRAIVGNGE